MEASRKRFVALFSIAVVSQALIVGLPAKAEEKVNLQSAQNKLEEGDYEQALKTKETKTQKRKRSSTKKKKEQKQKHT